MSSSKSKSATFAFLRLWFTDIFGNLKNVAITPSDIEIAFEEGIGFDGSSIDGLASLQDSDMLVHPDPSTFQVLPWRPSDDGVARMFCDLRTPDGAPAAGDSRHVLMNMLKRAGAMGYSVNIGTAVEYFCFKSDSAPEAYRQGGYFDLAPLDNASEPSPRNGAARSQKMGIPVEYSHHEAAPAQQEIDLRFCDALSAADAVVTARLVIKETAHAQGVHASFMPKPIEGQPGSAMHVHQSLFDERGNAFADTNDPDGMGLSSVAKSYIAGLLKYAPEYMLITNQYVNSYKRLVPGFDAPVVVSGEAETVRPWCVCLATSRASPHRRALRCAASIRRRIRIWRTLPCLEWASRVSRKVSICVRRSKKTCSSFLRLKSPNVA